MHLSSLDNMRDFRKRYLTGKEDSALKILDLGSMAIGGSYRSIFEADQWEYIGVDLVPGENVDIVLSDPYNWLEIVSCSIDVVVSGQTFEHTAYFWKTMTEIARVLAPGGLCCIIAPSGGREHQYPVDCWRFYPDGFRALAMYADLEVISVNTQWEPRGYSDESDQWADTVLIARKPEKKEPEKEWPEHLYHRKINIESEDSLSKIVRYIQPNKTVLELGPATGYLTKHLKETLGCSVHCIERSKSMAQEAEKHCEKMIVADIDSIQLEDHFSDNTYDYIVIADVLEHLREDAKTLISCRSLLKSDGKCILSIPNIGHASIIGGLIKGNFDYTNEGLLDRTHVRFYTKKSITSLLEKCGFSIAKIDTITKLPEDTEIGDSLTDLPYDIQKQILDTDDALTYQFILICDPNSEARHKIEESDQNPPSAIDLRRLHFQELNTHIEQLKSLIDELNTRFNARILELEEAFDQAQKLAFERLDALHASEETVHEYANALSYAERLAYERQDTILQQEAEIEMLRNHPGYKAYEKIKSLFRR